MARDVEVPSQLYALSEVDHTVSHCMGYVHHLAIVLPDQDIAGPVDVPNSSACAAALLLSAAQGVIQVS